jgi:hypothetical protein
VEVIAQWFDDLDDLVSAIGLVGERLRNLLIATVFLVLSLSLQAAAVMLALRHPPLASATATMLIVFLMYRSATAPRKVLQQAS